MNSYQYLKDYIEVMTNKLRNKNKRDIYFLTKKELAPIMESAKETFSCRKGCAHCCHIQVDITKIEAKPLLKFVLPKHYDQIRKLRHLTNEQFIEMPLKERKCIFLNSNNHCSIYSNRPLACRYYAVTSSPELCNTEFNAKQMVDQYFPKKLAGLLFSFYSLLDSKYKDKPKNMYLVISELLDLD